MATCPLCGGFLSEHHRCVGLWRRRARNAGASALAMLGGVLVSTVALYTLTSRPQVSTVAIGVVAGMIIGQAVWTAIRH